MLQRRIKVWEKVGEALFPGKNEKISLLEPYHLDNEKAQTKHATKRCS